MTDSDLLIKLRNTLPEATWPWTIPALQHDPVVWEFLRGSRQAAALNLLSRHPAQASPAALALLAMGRSQNVLTLCTNPMQPSPASLEALPAASPQEPANAGEPAAARLAAAGMQALGLREQRRLKGDWADLGAALVSLDRLALACLFGLTPDPVEMLLILAAQIGASPLATAAAPAADQTLLHALLANPIPPQTLEEDLLRLLVNITEARRIAILRELARYRPLVAVSAARRLLPALGSLKASVDYQHLSTDPYNSAVQLGTMLQTIDLAGLAGQKDHEGRLLADALRQVRATQAYLFARQAQLNGASEFALQAWLQAASLEPGVALYQAGQALTQAERNDLESAAKTIGALPGEPGRNAFFDYAQAMIEQGLNHLDEAYQAALRGLERIENDLFSGIDAFTPLADLPTRLARLFSELDHAAEARRAASLAVNICPGDAALWSQLWRASYDAGEYTASAAAALQAAALAPDQPAIRGQLAASLEAAGDWPAALKERQIVLERAGSPAAADLHAVAACAYQAGDFALTQEIAQKALAQDAQDGIAHSLLGLSYARLGRGDLALDHLEGATLLTPHQAAAWLTLADFYRQLNLPEKAKATLMAGVQAALAEPAMFLALAEAQLEARTPSLALNTLRQAAALTTPPAGRPADLPRTGRLSGGRAAPQAHALPLPGMQPNARQLISQIQLRLGQTLQQLGHLDDARLALETAFRLAPASPETAKGLASFYVASHEQAQAVAPLDVYLQSSPAEAWPYLEYARAVLDVRRSKAAQPAAESASPERALAALQHVLELDPACAEAHALMAETLVEAGALSEALNAYRAALDSTLGRDPAWQARLSLGLGDLALKLGQFETAIAAFQDAARADPANPAVQRSLAEAYDALGMPGEAYTAAQAALKLAGGEVENLVWFARKVVDLNLQPAPTRSRAYQDSIQAYQRAASLAPERPDLLVELADIFIKIGDHDSACETLRRLLTPDGEEQPDAETPASPGAATLLHAARRLNHLGDPQGAAACLEQALEQVPGQYAALGEPARLELLTELAAARQHGGQYDEAIAALDQALEAAPEDTRLLAQKSALLVQIGRLDEGQEHLSRALALNPDDSDLREQAVHTCRALKDLPAALAHAERLADLSNRRPRPAALRARLFIADLLRAMLMPEKARAVLQESLPALGRLTKGDNTPEEQATLFESLASLAELALELNDDAAAFKYLSTLLEMAPGHARALAMQARLAARQTENALGGGHSEAALGIFEAAWQALQEMMKDGRLAPLTDRLALALAALDLRQWERAIELLQALAQQVSGEPWCQALLAQALVLRAEFDQFCSELAIIRRAPAKGAQDEAAWLEFLEAIQTVEGQIEAFAQQSQASPRSHAAWVGALDFNAPRQQMLRWRSRGEAAFQPGAARAETLANLANTPEDTAARLACLRRAGDLAAANLAARMYPQNPLVLAQLALSLAPAKPHQAVAAARAASDLLEQGGAGRTSYTVQSLAPAIYALEARLLFTQGIRAEDRHNAQIAIEKALKFWPDEPRWHVLAAEIALQQPNATGSLADESGAKGISASAAIEHLQQAIRLEPENGQHPLRLGKVFAQHGNLPAATEALETAARLCPDDPEPNLALAQAYTAAGELNQAASRAERAVSLAPNQVEPLLLRGEIALQAGNPRGALSRAQAALRLRPDEPEVLFLLGKAFNELDRPADALAAFNRALEFSANPLPIHLEKTRLVRAARGAAAALAEMQGVAQRFPDDHRALYLYAELLDENQQTEEAVNAVQRALRIVPKLAAPGAAQTTDAYRIHTLLGRMQRKTGQLDQAIYHLSEAARLAPAAKAQPPAVDVYLELGHAHSDRRHYAQAIHAYQQAIACAPEDYRPYYQAGLALKESKDYLGAEQMLRYASELAPDDLGIHRLLAAVVALNLVHNRRPASTHA